MQIQDFKTALQGGGARPNQFIVELTFPTFVSGGNQAGRKAQFLAESASLPGSTLGIANGVFYRGREIKIAGDRTFANWQVQILNDTDFAVHAAVQDWINSINDTASNTGLTDPSSYVADLTVRQLDRANDQPIKAYKFRDAWPVNQGDIALDFSANDQIEKFSVEFAYLYWEEISPTS